MLWFACLSFYCDWVDGSFKTKYIKNTKLYISKIEKSSLTTHWRLRFLLMDVGISLIDLPLCINSAYSSGVKFILWNKSFSLLISLIPSSWSSPLWLPCREPREATWSLFLSVRLILRLNLLSDGNPLKDLNWWLGRDSPRSPLKSSSDSSSLSFVSAEGLTWTMTLSVDMLPGRASAEFTESSVGVGSKIIPLKWVLVCGQSKSVSSCTFYIWLCIIENK